MSSSAPCVVQIEVAHGKYEAVVYVGSAKPEPEPESESESEP